MAYPRLLVTGFFDCRITQYGEYLGLEKLTGSQRFTGMLYSQENGIAFKGAGHYGYEQSRSYGDDESRNKVGCLFESLGQPGSLLLELPSPEFESTHDVIELVQQN